MVEEGRTSGCEGLDSREERSTAERRRGEGCCPAHRTGSIVERGYLTVRSPFMPAA